MTYHFQNPNDGVVKRYLENSKVIAVVGLSDREETTSNRVSKEMQERGYRIIPVNPRAAGSQIFGETVYASLKDIPFPVDIVDVYRRSEFCQMWRVIFWKQMPRFSGLSWAWKMKKLSRFCGQLVAKISLWIAASNASIPAWFWANKWPS